MLTRAQIQRIAQRNGINVQAQERDYIQHLLLWLTYSRDQSLILKGGMALRMVYGGNRFSENLELSAANDGALGSDVRRGWLNTAGGLLDFGIVAEMCHEWESGLSCSFDVAFRGPLYDGRPGSEGRVRVSVERDSVELDTRRELVTSEYDDVRPFVVTVVSPEFLMAEKVCAVMILGKPRDLYDLWLMLGLGIRPEHRLIERKLAQHSIHWHLRRLVETLDSVEPGWERDLKHLLPQYVPYKTVRDGVVAWLVGIS